MFQMRWSPCGKGISGIEAGFGEPEGPQAVSAARSSCTDHRTGCLSGNCIRRDDVWVYGGKSIICCALFMGRIDENVGKLLEKFEQKRG